MTLVIDSSTDFGKRIERRLNDELICWLTTVDASGRPFPSPVWFLREADGTLLIYSQPNKTKLRNIAENAAVAVNFNSTATGDDMIVFAGAAVIDESANPAANHEAYLAKYQERIRLLGMTGETFSAEYSVPIRVVLEKVRGF